MKYIFLFTLSPVKSFIAQARKTQDLYAGSLILSKLTKIAADVAKNEKIILIFPENTQNTEGGASFPNRFIGTIEGVFSHKELQNIGQRIEDKVKETFKGFADDALDRVELRAPYRFDKIMFDAQINNHLDINWLFHKIEISYEKSFKEVEHLMAALKNVRLITNYESEVETGRKCSIDGERNALFFGQSSNPKYVEFNKGEIVTTKNVWLNKNEGLSAVSLIKRTYEKQGFPSTAQIALTHQINNLKKEKPNLFECFEQLFSRSYPVACSNLLLKGYLDKIEFQYKLDDWCTDFDEQFLFEDNLIEKNIVNPTQLHIAREVQQQFKSILTDKHYAIIAFDGDKMGKLLSGELRKDKSGDLAEFQKEVSTLLIQFSQGITNDKSEKYIWKNEKKPNVVYTGGDDFLGFVNLNYLFEVVTQLRIEFDIQVNKELQKKYTLEKDNQPFDLSFSMGIVIAPYKTPLSIVLAKAREMEKLAKNEEAGNRNAFAIAALKDAGDSHEAYFKWDLDKDNKLPKWEALKELIEAFKNDCSETFVRSLDREFYNLQDDKGKIKNNVERLKYTDDTVTPKIEVDKGIQMMQTELFRLAYKSLEEGKKGKAIDIQKTVWHFFETEDKITHHSIAAKNGIEAVKIALFIKRKMAKDKDKK